MNAMMRRAVIGTAAVSMALSIAACGKAGDDSKDAKDSGSKTKIGLLLPENKTARYETLDKPLFVEAVKKDCPDCVVEYKNAAGDVGAQKQQFDQQIADGIKVIAISSVDAEKSASWVKTAHTKGVKVVAYDRAIAGADAYVSHDNEKIGKLQGQAILDALGTKAATSNLVMINGDEKDPNAGLFKKGAHESLDGKIKIAYEASGEWDPKIAGEKMAAAVSSVGKDKINAVYSANDGMAGGIITAIANAGIKGIPVGGQDAELPGIQRIIAGTQTFTIYKSPKQLAPAAAQFAVNLLQGKDIGAQGKTDGVPSTLLEPTVIKKDNIASTVIKDGIYKVSDVCSADIAAKCTALGIK
ncbi:sugar ABC transporter substrate-binding protein [Streptomyces beijiangensis]|uniref:Substrate-binding domain-containing protein n=1 Tax=Streptomyces beijiangensis TaxID=163361 RepID=A0A939F8E4_9ACTN|nr:substrate-binding domain-containing protein [Streptomyces beijiangensis]MBO0513554.1 substrate-binding domain-containing protein [Streptomyces beijiangensis]